MQSVTKFHFSPAQRELIAEALTIFNSDANTSWALQHFEEDIRRYRSCKDFGVEAAILGMVGCLSKAAADLRSILEPLGVGEFDSKNGEYDAFRRIARRWHPDASKQDVEDNVSTMFDMWRDLGDMDNAAERVEEKARRKIWRSKSQGDKALCQLFIDCTRTWRLATGRYPRPVRFGSRLTEWARVWDPIKNATLGNPIELVLDGTIDFERGTLRFQPDRMEHMVSEARRRLRKKKS